MNTTLEQTHHETIDHLIETTERYLTREHMILAWLHNHWRELVALADTGLAMTRSNEGIDFDNPSREQVLMVIKTIPGSWNKSVMSADVTGTNAMMHYRLDKDGLKFRIWNAELPPTCKKVTRVIPAQPEKVVEEIECNVRETETELA